MQANGGALTDTEALEIGKKGSGRVPRPEPFLKLLTGLVRSAATEQRLFAEGAICRFP